MVLMMTLDLARRHVDGDRRRCIEVVAGTLIAHPRPAVARAPEGQIGCRIVVAAHPDRPAAGLPLITARRPRLAPRLTRRWNRVDAPRFLAGPRSEERRVGRR